MKRNVPSRLLMSLALLSLAVGSLLLGATTRAQETQTLLGPGLYVFQTRITAASCGDADRTGYVNSYVAAVEGIPGSREMAMRLPNSQYWARWTLDVRADGHILAASEQSRVEGHNHFDVTQHGRQFTGTGARSYMRGTTRCEVTYDALLRRTDR